MYCVSSAFAVNILFAWLGSVVSLFVLYIVLIKLSTLISESKHLCYHITATVCDNFLNKVKLIYVRMLLQVYTIILGGNAFGKVKPNYGRMLLQVYTITIILGGNAFRIYMYPIHKSRYPYTSPVSRDNVVVICKLTTHDTHKYLMMEFELLFILLLLLCWQPSVLLVASCSSTCCPADEETRPLYVLTLASLPRALPGLSGHRIARDEINNHTDLLPGYHIELIVDTIEDCSSLEAGVGLSNLLKYTLNPPCHPVVAVAGLGCSSHTSVLSPVAGHDGFDLIQLSSANSPIFETQNNRFPHLWRFLGSGIAYSDTVLAIMDQYNWTRIGVVYDIGSVFHSEIAKILMKNIKLSTSKKVTFSLGLRGTRKFYLDAAISNIRGTETTILISLLSVSQTEALLNRALTQGLVYPQYTWIHIRKLQEYFQNNETIDAVHNATRGHIFLHTQHDQEGTVLVSGETFETFERKYSDDLKILAEEYMNMHSVFPVSFAANWYDEIWALAVAINGSLAFLKERNLSIDNYTIGQNDITAVIEEQMANLSFQGAGGWVEFNEYRAVSTPVEVYWLDHGKQELVGKLERVGIYNPLNPSDFHVHINASKLPNDTLYRRYEFLLIPRPVAILMYILTGAVIIFTTIQLIVYLYYREHMTVKATSPYVSLLMFAGCYLFCLSVILYITRDSFVLSPRAYTIIVCLIFALVINAINLILITLFVKLLRVERIFQSTLRTDLGRYWSNVPLFVIILFLTIFLNVIVIPILILETPGYEKHIINFKDVIQVHVRPVVKGNLILISVLLAYLIIFLMIISCLAIRTRKIRYSNFKDTKKINLLIVLLIVINFVSVIVYVMLYLTHRRLVINIMVPVWILSVPVLFQLILFSPKIVPVVLEELSPKVSKFKHMYIF